MPEAIVFVARVALGVVFVASGLLKGRDPSWPQAAQAFGAPNWLVPVLPWVEVIVGVLVAAQFRAAAAAALLLLVVFTLALRRQVARHERVPCRCFGALSAGEPGSRALLRNAGLCALALLALL